MVGKEMDMQLSCARVVALLGILALIALPAIAKPNFTGDWKLNTAKSDFGPMPPPSSMTEKITHDDPKLKVAISQSTDRGDFDFEVNYTTDGKECTNEFRGNEMKSTLKWEGDTLVVDTKGRFGDNDVTMQDKWKLSGDGKTLTVSRHFSSSMGEADQTLVLEKQ
jgi:hypothetical protein